MEGQHACFDYINDQGGIDGAKIEYRWEDIAANIPQAITAHRRNVEWGAVAEIKYLGLGCRGTPSQFTKK